MFETETKDQTKRKVHFVLIPLVIFNQKQIQVGVMLISSTSQTVPSVLDDTPQNTGDLNSKDRREMVDVCCSSFVDNKTGTPTTDTNILHIPCYDVIELLWAVGGRGWYLISMVLACCCCEHQTHQHIRNPTSHVHV